MTLIKSVSVGIGDMFYIVHNSDNFTMIDCMLPTDPARRRAIVDEYISQSSGKAVSRFISTHPDQDHVQGLKYLDDRMGILNFYCVDNDATKEDPTSDFLHYCDLRDHPSKSFHIYKGCRRKWMNIADEERGESGIEILWPATANPHYREALEVAATGGNPNNTSCVIQYTLNAGIRALWMGDLETDFMEEIDGAFEPPSVDLLFAPHHGRESGRVPDRWLKEMDPAVIVLGEAPSEYLYYYPGWNVISQNSAGDITFDCVTGRTDVFVGSPSYTVDFLYDAGRSNDHGYYLGSFDCEDR